MLLAEFAKLAALAALRVFGEPANRVRESILGSATRMEETSGMREFSDATGFESARDATLFTVCVLEASGAHEKAAKALSGVVARWDVVDAARRKAEDGVTRANAKVAWCDWELDVAVKKFANELLRDANGDGKNTVFRSFFPSAPSETIRLGLENEIEQCEAMLVTSERVKLSKGAADALKQVKAASAKGSKALAERKAAYAAQAVAWLDVAAWKQAANAARVSVFVQLQAWAVSNGEDRSLADKFFPAPGPKKAKKAGNDEGNKPSA